MFFKFLTKKINFFTFLIYFICELIMNCEFNFNRIYRFQKKNLFKKTFSKPLGLLKHINVTCSPATGLVFKLFILFNDTEVVYF